MAKQVAVNEKGFTVLYDAPDPTVEYVFLCVLRLLRRTGCAATIDGPRLTS